MSDVSPPLITNEEYIDDEFEKVEDEELFRPLSRL